MQVEAPMGFSNKPKPLCWEERGVGGDWGDVEITEVRGECQVDTNVLPY